MGIKTKPIRDYSKSGRINWLQTKNIQMLESLIKRGFTVEAIANRMNASESSIRSAIDVYTVGLRRLRHESNKGQK